MQMSGKRYGLGAAGPEAGAAYDDDVRMRVVADHVRSSLMLIGDGVRPGNDGRVRAAPPDPPRGPLDASPGRR